MVKMMRFVKSPTKTSLKAFCDVAVEDRIVIRGIRVVEGRHGPFISMPRQKSGKGDWHDSVVCIDKTLQAELRRLVLDAYYNDQ